MQLRPDWENVKQPIMEDIVRDGDDTTPILMANEIA